MNHFIEVDKDEEGKHYLVVHTGSRNLGKQVAEYYQDLAIKLLSGKAKLKEAQDSLITEYKNNGRQQEIQQALKKLQVEYSNKYPKIPEDLCYLAGEHREKYLHDIKICQEFAEENRAQIANTIIAAMEWKVVDTWQTIHNYIEFETNMIRKGAISAKLGEKVLIPMNMRDGAIVAIGKGNEDWNCSAPHGAGRIMNRGEAKECIALEDFKESMEGIYTTSVNQSTIDESPMVYKPMEEIIKNIKDTVEIIKVIKPVYNFKASE